MGAVRQAARASQRGRPRASPRPASCAATTHWGVLRLYSSSICTPAHVHTGQDREAVALIAVPSLPPHPRSPAALLGLSVAVGAADHADNASLAARPDRSPHGTGALVAGEGHRGMPLETRGILKADG